MVRIHSSIFPAFGLGLIFIMTLGGSVFVRATDREAETDRKSGPAFVSVCKIEYTNLMPKGAIFYVPEGSILAIVHELGQIKSGYEQTVLYTLTNKNKNKNPRYWAMGWKHWEMDSFFGAEGGIMSAAIASDVFNYLKKMPFHFVKDWQSFLLGERQFEPCAIEYEGTKRYLEAIGHNSGDKTPE